MKTCQVAIVGAGPYGLSVAAHLRARGVNFRIFGNPMRTWLEHMPRGMRLKSEGFASSLDDPGSTFTLAAYCKEKGLPYADIGLPVTLETFSAYGLEFQKRLVPSLEQKLVSSLKSSPEGYQLSLDDGETLVAKKVVLAIGLSYYDYIPPALSSLPASHLTHSSKHKTVDEFKGRKVIVLGGGASAVDLAALMHQAGAQVQVVCRKPAIRFHSPPDNTNPTWLDQLRCPTTGIGPGWKLFLCTSAPLVFRLMPESFRLEKVRTILGPAPGWFVKDEVVGKVPMHCGLSVSAAKAVNGGVKLELVNAAGANQTLEAEHVVAATGYRVDLRRLNFMDPSDLARIRTVENTPVLSSYFESSLPNLYFVGTSAANTFGPLLRFACGAKFTARRIVQHLA